MMKEEAHYLLTTRKDVEAVARSRVNRAEGKKTNSWTLVALAVAVIGLLVYRYWLVVGMVLMIGGLGAFCWYAFYALEKKQNATKAQLLKEWRQEQVKK